MAATAVRSDDIYLLVRTRSVLACLLHWILFAAIVVLVVTGFYIAYPMYYFGTGEAYQAFAMANIRTYHFIAANVMMGALALRFYLAFTTSCNRDILQFAPTPRNIVNAIKLAFFFSSGRGEHQHYRFVNPLGGIGIFMMAVCMLLMVVTGFTLYFPAGEPTSLSYALSLSIANLLGGLQTVRLLHHTVMYLLMSLVVIHVYMQMWKNIVYTESDISSIIAGYKLFPRSEIGHFADYYGLRLDEPPPSEEEMKKASTPMEDLSAEG